MAIPLDNLTSEERARMMLGSRDTIQAPVAAAADPIPTTEEILEAIRNREYTDFDSNAGIFQLLGAGAGGDKYETIRTPRDEMLGLPGRVYDKETGELAPEDVQIAALNLPVLGGGPSADMLEGDTAAEKYALMDQRAAEAYDARRAKEKKREAFGKKIIATGIDLFAGPYAGIGSALVEGVSGGDLGDVLEAGVKGRALTSGVKSLAGKAGFDVAKVATPDIAGDLGKLGDKLNLDLDLGGTGKFAKGVGAIKDFGEDLKDVAKSVGGGIEDVVKDVGESFGIDKEKRDEIREFFGDTEDKAKEKIKETIDKTRDKIIEGGGAAADAAADAASGINLGGILAGGAGALLLDQLLNQQPAPDNYAQVRQQYEAQKPTLTGFAPVGTAIPRVGLPVQGFANGGLSDLAPFQAYGQISGPGTGTSDSIPAYLSDGEFVMTAKAVKGLGNGDKNKGAAKMYAMMDKFESMA